MLAAVYQRLIRSRALAGDRLGAASIFTRYCRLIETELGIEPSPATIAAFLEVIGQTATRRS